MIRSEVWAHRALLGLTLLVAVALRLWGLSFGFPALTHSDEPQVVMVAVNAALGQFSPGFFAYPALFPYLAGLFTWLWVQIQPWAWPDFQAFFDHYCSDPTPAYLAVRSCSALAGVAVVAATAWLGRRVAGPRVGLLAAAMMAVNTYAVRDSHFATTDIPATLAATLAMVALVAVCAGATPRRLVVAGLAVGLAAATKYPAGILALLVPVAAVIGSRGGALERVRSVVPGLAMAGLTCTLAFLLTNPYLLLDWQTFAEDMARESARRLEVSPAQFGGPPWRWYLGRTLPTAFGWPALGAAVAGAAWAIAARQAKLALLVGATALLLLPTFLVVSVGERYLLPAFPAVAVLAAWAAVRASKRSRPRGLWLANTLLALLAAAMLLPPLLRSLRLDSLLTLPDTRVLAAEWIEDNLAPGRRIALEWAYTPQVDGERFVVLPLRYEAGSPAAQNADYLVVSSYAFNRYFIEPQAHPHEIAFFEQLDAGPAPIATFSGLPPERAYDLVERVPPGPLDQQEMVGPEIRIYGPLEER